MVSTVKNPATTHVKRAAPASMLLKFKAKDGVLGVQKSTVKIMSDLLGLNETDVVHLALTKLAKEVIPAYAPDDGALTESQLNKIRKLSGINQTMPISSALFGAM